MPVARVQRPTEPAGETASVSPFGIKLYKTVPLPYKKANDYRSVNLREGVSERRWRSAANRPTRQRRPGGWGALSQSKPADETATPLEILLNIKNKIPLPRLRGKRYL